MRKYWSITQGSFMSTTTYMYGMVFTFIGNLAYIVVLYFLWQQIFGKSISLQGMSFNQVFVYLALASSIFNLFRTWTEWGMSFSIRDGTIVVDLIKPLDYQLRVFAESFGRVLVNALVITIPSALMVFVVFGASIPTGINVLIFPLSILLAFVLSFMLDYMVGLTTFYTESLWGISVSKDIIVTLLSGALVPLQFFPDSMRHILERLPFMAIYHVPLQIMTDPDLVGADFLKLIGLQLFWMIVLTIISRLFYTQVIKVVTINGG